MNMLRTRSNAFTFNVGRPSEALLGRVPVIPCGRAVGGGSSVNCRFLSSVLLQKSGAVVILLPQSWFTIGHLLLITTLGTLHTGTEDGGRTN